MPDNFVFEFQDSEVSSAELKEQQFVVQFSAAHVHRSRSKDGIDLDGFLHALVLTIFQPSTIQKDSGCLGRISQGELRVEGNRITRVPIPYEANANVELELSFSNGSMCRVSGQHVTLNATGEVKFVEWLRC